MTSVNAISIYSITNYNNKLIPIKIVLYKNGVININGEFRETYNANDINNIIYKPVNKIINIIRSLLEQNGYEIADFKNIFEDNVDIVNIKYTMICSINKNINLTKYNKCLLKFFNEVDINENKSYLYRYKRVSNYNEYNEIDIFVLEQIKKGANPNDIIKKMIDNFNITQKESENTIRHVLSNLKMKENLHKKEKLIYRIVVVF